MCDVLLACPDKLDRLVHLFGDERAFRSVVADGAAAEGAAHVALVEVHLLDVETKRLRHGLAGFVGGLTALPDFRPITRSVDPNHGVQRFHLRVIPVVAAEFGGVGLRRIAKGSLHVPLFFQLYSRGIGIPADLDIILKRCLGVEPISFGFRPRDSQGIAACLGVLEMIGNHGEPVVKLHNGDDAFHGAYLRIVPAFRRGTGFVLLAWIPDLDWAL